MSLLALLGVHSRREVQRAQFRAKAAMRAQVAVQGRHLGGRPPYGYTLADAGPHPNKGHARWGRRLLRLEPDPVTAPTVRWIFDERLAGRSISGIARDLNSRAVPVRRRFRPEPAPVGCRVGLDDGGGDSRQPALDGPAGVEPPTSRVHRPGRGRSHRPEPDPALEHEVVIRCGYYTWQLELDGARIDNGRRRRRNAQDTSR